MNSLLAVFAHPDDESLAAGGLLARHTAQGGRATVLTCTWERTTTRGAELAAATRILGCEPPRFLEYADARVAESASNLGRFVDAPLDDLVRRMVGEIRQVRPGTVVTHDAVGNLSGHPDHGPGPPRHHAGFPGRWPRRPLPGRRGGLAAGIAFPGDPPTFSFDGTRGRPRRETGCVHRSGRPGRSPDRRHALVGREGRGDLGAPLRIPARSTAGPGRPPVGRSAHQAARHRVVHEYRAPGTPRQ